VNAGGWGARREVERTRLVTGVELPPEQVPEEARGTLAVGDLQGQGPDVGEAATGDVCDRHGVGFEVGRDEPPVAEGIVDRPSARAVLHTDRPERGRAHVYRL